MPPQTWDQEHRRIRHSASLFFSPSFPFYLAREVEHLRDTVQVYVEHTGMGDVWGRMGTGRGFAQVDNAAKVGAVSDLGAGGEEATGRNC